jgi:hypothetical protein
MDNDEDNIKEGKEVKDVKEDKRQDSDLYQDNGDFFDFETLKLIKLNLKNKKIELPKQNSLYKEIKEYFKDEPRITFYHLGLYKLIKGF